MDLFNTFRAMHINDSELSLWHLAELPVGMDSERWEEKVGEMNNLNGRGVTWF